ncbi:hypothetical protein DSM106972_048760 [Dulcicalothrix desertica PCC 7102]|uniref:Uncharacterized protein n=1 Tax=Dulcicalothrix desertica PCC 7102 TaxID=232991 RepID=A0A433VCW4_9CYAN|nr:hypothetical protein [Dulcicalothrix desertica]RUT03962.1 hypothetical protein DSM106972_048760 [Dulcicalothrix desertica PCC 7102]TWH43630.1 hypothetical protein CAL7102_07369 [Dulcicalothrix desertica PCC 7102]
MATDQENVMSTEEAFELLLGKGSSTRGAELEKEAEVPNICAGLDWGNALPKLLLNPGLYWRLKTLRISLNREIRLKLENMDLGVGKKPALETARAFIKEKLISPSPEILPHLEAVLAQDDLYNEEFISNREVLQSLLEVLLTSEDKEAIAAAAAHKVRLSVLS